MAVMPWSKPSRDHLGTEYPSESAMCRAWNLSQPTYVRRIRQGLSVEEALTQGTRGNRTPCADHTGKQHPSIRAMCAAWGVTRDTYIRRRSKGWSLEAALTEPADGTFPMHMGGPVTDHKGKTYKTLKAMCDAYGTTVSRYRGRLALGWDVGRALEERTQANERRYVGPDGQAAKSFRAWLDFNGLRRDRNRRDIGSLEDMRRAMAEDWPGRAFGAYEIIRAVEYPWFEVRKDGIAAVMHADALRLEYIGTEWPKTPSAPKHGYPDPEAGLKRAR